MPPITYDPTTRTTPLSYVAEPWVNPYPRAFALHIPCTDVSDAFTAMRVLMSDAHILAMSAGDDWIEWCEPAKAEQSVALHVEYWTCDPISVARGFLETIGKELDIQTLVNVPFPGWIDKACLTSALDWSEHASYETERTV